MRPCARRWTQCTLVDACELTGRRDKLAGGYPPLAGRRQAGAVPARALHPRRLPSPMRETPALWNRYGRLGELF